MRASALVIAIAVALVVPAGPSVAQERGPANPGSATVSPSVSPSPGPPGGRRTARPGFVVLLVLLGLGLLWQIQRARRTTADVAGHTLEDLERTTRPRPPPPD